MRQSATRTASQVRKDQAKHDAWANSLPTMAEIEARCAAKKAARQAALAHMAQNVAAATEYSF